MVDTGAVSNSTPSATAELTAWQNLRQHLALIVSVLAVLLVCLRALLNSGFDVETTRLLLGVATPSHLLGTALLALFSLLLSPATVSAWLLTRFWPGSDRVRIASSIGLVSTSVLLIATQSVIVILLTLTLLIVSDIMLRRRGLPASERQRLKQTLSQFGASLLEWQSDIDSRKSKVAELTRIIQNSRHVITRRDKVRISSKIVRVEGPRYFSKILPDALAPWRTPYAVLDEIEKRAKSLNEEIAATSKRYDAEAKEIRLVEERLRHWRSRIPSRLGLRIYLTITFLGVCGLTLASPWTAVEQVTNNSGDVTEGYVVGEQAGYLLVLRQDDRAAVWLPLDNIGRRQLCREAASWPSKTIPGLLKANYPECAS